MSHRLSLIHAGASNDNGVASAELVCTALLACSFLFAAASAAAADGVPDSIRHYETVRPTLKSATTRDFDAVATRVTFDAFGRRFDVELERSPLFSPTSTIVWIGARGERETAPAPTHYVGRVRGETASTAAFTVVDGRVIEGAVRTGGTVYFLEPMTRFETRSALADLMIYRLSDIDGVEGEEETCGAEEVPHLQAPRGTAGSPSRESAADLSAVASESSDVLEISVVADHEVYLAHGAGTADYIHGMLNEMAAIYLRDLQLSLRVVETVVYETAADPFTSSDPVRRLGEVAAYRRARGGRTAASGLTHLFSAQELDGAAIGIAYFNQLCHADLAAGLSQQRSSAAKTVLVAAHEIGHTLGAWHDGEANSPCQTVGRGYLMWPSLGSEMMPEFSDCSSVSMASRLATASCVVRDIPSGCGDGTLGDGEECDDGNNTDGDCCARDCTLDAPGVACSEDGDVCTDDACDGAGTCVHPYNEAPCADGDVCTLSGRCHEGTCVASEVPNELDFLKLGLKFESGGGNDSLKLKAAWSVDALASTPADGGFVLEIADEFGTPLYTAFVPPSMFVCKGDTEPVFQFHADDVRTADTSGLVKAQVKYSPAKGLVVVKAAMRDFEIPQMAGLDALLVRVQIGDDSAGQCASAFDAVCSSGRRGTICER